MDIRKVKKLIEMLEESSIAEIEIHEGEESVRVSRHSSAAPVQAVIQTQQAGAGPGMRAASSAGAEGGLESAAAVDRVPEGFKVKSPMVGIFYSSPAPGKPPFVELGKAVVKGDVLCIIEAMKIMNQVEAETSGIIAKIMVENGEPIEYGQPLFVIREEA